MYPQIPSLPPLPIATPDVQQIIQSLERHHLNQATPPAQAVWGAKIEQVPYLRILGQSRFWEEENSLSSGYESHAEDLIAGFYGHGLNFAYLILGSKQDVQVYVGLKGEGAGSSLLAPALQGIFPGIYLDKLENRNLGSARKDSGLFTYMGRLSGIPTRKSGMQSALDGAPKHPRLHRADAGGVQQIERLLRALYGEEWGYLVWAAPHPEASIHQKIQQHLTSLTQVSVQGQISENAQVTVTQTTIQNTSTGVTTSRSANITNYWVQHVSELLERDLGRYQIGLAQGMWQTDVYFFAGRPETLSRLKMLLRAIFAGEDSTPDPLRTFACEMGAAPSSSSDFSTVLNSAELASLCQFPREEFPGYRLSDYARFDVDLPAAPANAISVGQVLDGRQATGGWFSINRPDLAKHGLIVGVTGSGKTNTIFHLLHKAWNHGNGIPFLVIEPAKTEYRDLLKRDEFAHCLRIYTLGDERIAPFRINPFVFEIANADNRIHVQTHIDFLKSVFNAAFILYAPMPYVLETCLHEIYQDKGWDLTTGQNRRVPLQERGQEYQWAAFPTLTDLYNKIDEVVNRLGYDERIERDVKAGLKARIGSLRLGGKGLMLDTRIGVSMADLLAMPTVLELERIGNDDEKAFVIGLILTRLYEYRMVQARSVANLPPIQHVMIFEEAHRLLKNVKTDVGAEEANTKGQSVETFSNMLSLKFAPMDRAC